MIQRMGKITYAVPPGVLEAFCFDQSWAPFGSGSPLVGPACSTYAEERLHKKDGITLQLPTTPLDIPGTRFKTSPENHSKKLSHAYFS